MTKYPLHFKLENGIPVVVNKISNGEHQFIIGNKNNPENFTSYINFPDHDIKKEGMFTGNQIDALQIFWSITRSE